VEPPVAVDTEGVAVTEVADVFPDGTASITPVAKPSAGSSSIAVPTSPLPRVDFRFGRLRIGVAFFVRGRGRGLGGAATWLAGADTGAVDTGAGTGDVGAVAGGGGTGTGDTGAGGDPVGAAAADADDVAAVAVLALTGFFAVFCFLRGRPSSSSVSEPDWESESSSESSESESVSDSTAPVGGMVYFAAFRSVNAACAQSCWADFVISANFYSSRRASETLTECSSEVIDHKLIHIFRETGFVPLRPVHRISGPVPPV
jgi:hypothetical protein